MWEEVEEEYLEDFCKGVFSRFLCTLAPSEKLSGGGITANAGRKNIGLN